MLKYSDDKNIFSGDTCLEVVQEMKKAAYCNDKSDLIYMCQVRDRVNILKGIKIRVNAEGFLNDLESLGILHFIRNLS